MSEDQLEAFLVEPLQRYTDNTITEADRLRGELAAIRRRGYAINRGGFRPDVGGVGAIIRDHQGRPAAAISVCVPMFRFDRMDVGVLGAHVRRAAAEASRSLGLREPATGRRSDKRLAGHAERFIAPPGSSRLPPPRPGASGRPWPSFLVAAGHDSGTRPMRARPRERVPTTVRGNIQIV